MYKTDFVCTYRAFEELEDDEVNSDMLYRAQFLQIFGLTEYNDAAIHAGLELIKAKAAEVPELKALIMQHPYSAAKHEARDDHDDHDDDDDDDDDDDAAANVLLPLMFAYPLMDVFHLCLIDAFKTGSISSVCRDKLLQAYSALV
jgi:hypothetical protein